MFYRYSFVQRGFINYFVLAALLLKASAFGLIIFEIRLTLNPIPIIFTLPPILIQ